MSVTRVFGVVAACSSLAMGVALGACGSTTAASSGPAQPAKPPNCEFEMLTVVPASGFIEIGVVDVTPGSYGTNIYREIADFKAEIQPHVCKAGGDAAVAYANGDGMYIKAAILRRTGGVANEAPAAPAPASNDGGCKFDTQCKGDRICVEGRCVDPGSKAGSASEP